MKGPSVNKAAIAEQEKLAAEKEARVLQEEQTAAELSRSKQASRTRARSGRGAGGNTLLTGLETGIRRETLG